MTFFKENIEFQEGIEFVTVLVIAALAALSVMVGDKQLGSMLAGGLVGYLTRNVKK